MPAALVSTEDGSVWPEPAAPLGPKAGRVRPIELSVIVPTYNEVANLDRLLAGISTALKGVSWEAIIVDDDSPDCTYAHARMMGMGDGRIRTIRRVGRRGLSSACIEGMLASSARYVAVIDADLQHDPALLDRMLDVLRQGEVDVVVGSRYITGGTIGEWGGSRALLSQYATRVTQHVTRLGLTDPMSGYFALRRERLEEIAPRLSGRGFKILLDLLLSAERPWRGKEIPLVFGIRTAGESKLSASVAWQCALLLVEKTIGRYVPLRMISFGLVGLAGVGVHFAVLSTLLLFAGVRFALAQAVATCTAIVVNFGVNNLFTHSDRALKGRDWWRGLASFALICGFGAIANVGIASFLFERNTPWTLASLAGIAVSAAWNYAMSARYTWRAGDAF